MPNKLLILVGPKGSGKSHIGCELESLFQIKYVRIESVWQELKERRSDFLSPDYIREGRQLTLDLVRSHLKDRHVCIEASGIADDWDEYISNLRSIADVVFVKVICSLAECKKRAMGRDQSLQVQISDDLFDQINEKAAHIELNWAATISNEPFINQDRLNSLMHSVLQKNGFL
jgi:shikimate kinase